MLNDDILMRVTEAYAEGAFDELFDVQWSSLDSYLAAARDYVPRARWTDFEHDLRTAIARGKA